MKNFDQILVDLRDPSEEIRQTAVMDLIKTNDMTVIPILRDLASSDESVKIRYYAKKGLHFLKSKTLPRALSGKQPQGGESPEDFDGAQAVVQPGTPPSAEASLPSQTISRADTGPHSRESHALKAESSADTGSPAGTIGGPVPQPGTQPPLTSPASARVAPHGGPAGASLQPLPGDSLSAEIVQTFSTGDDDGKINIVQRAVKLSATQTLPLLQNLLEGEQNPFVKSKLIVALGILGAEDQIPVLRSYLGDPDYRIRANTIEALGYIGHRSVYPLILEALNDDDNRIRANAIKIINKFGRTKVKDLLENMIRGGDPAMIASAVSVIGEIGRAELIPLLSDAAAVGGSEIMPKVEQALMNLSKQDPEAARILEELKKSTAAGKTSPSSIEDIITQKIRESLSSKNPELRLKGVSEAAASSNPALARPLAELISRESDPKIRAAAVNAIGRVGARDVLGIIEKALLDSDPRTRANAVEVYGTASPEGLVQSLEPLLADGSNRVKANAALALARTGHAGATAAIAAMASSGDPMTQRSAIYVIMDLEGREDLVAMLGPLVSSADPAVRSKAIESLGILAGSGSNAASTILSRGGIVETQEEMSDLLDQGTARTGSGVSAGEGGAPGQSRETQGGIRDAMVSDLDIERMIFDLGSENPVSRKNAARILESIGDERCLDALQIATKDQDNSVRYYAGKAFNAIKRRIDFEEKVVQLRPSRGDALDLKELERLLAEGNRDTRISAIQQVKITDHQTLPLLLRQIAIERDDFVKPALVSTIGMLGDERVVPALLPHLASEDPRVRANTIEALEYTCDSSVFSHIVPMLQDSNNRVKANAIKALQNNGKEGTLNLLTEMAGSSEVWMRDSAAFALGTIKDSKALKILESLLMRDSNPSVIIKAARSLSQICGRQGINIIKELMKRTRADGLKTAALSAALDACEGKQVDFQALVSNLDIPAPPMAAVPEGRIASQPGQAASRQASVAEAAGKPVKRAKDESAATSGIAETAESPGPGSSHETAKPDRPAATALTDGDLSARSHATAPQSPANELKGQEITSSDKAGKVVAKLSSDLGNEDEEVRKKAVLALSKIDHPDVLPLLETAANDKETVVRFFAKKALQARKKTRQERPGSEPQVSGVSQVKAGLGVPKTDLSSIQGGVPAADGNGVAPAAPAGEGSAKSGARTSGSGKVLKAIAAVLIAVGLGVTWYLNQDSGEEPRTADPFDAPETVAPPVIQPKPTSTDGKPDISRFFAPFDDKAAEGMKWGNLNARKTKFDKAAEDFSKAVDAAPLSLEANLKYLYCLSRTGSQRLASAKYRKSMSEKPNEPLFTYLLAIAAPSKEMAERELSTLASSNPGFPYSLLSLAAIRMSAGEWRAALEPLGEFTKIMGQVPVAVLAKAKCFLGADLAENAVTEFEEVIDRYRDDPAAILLGGRIYIRTGKFDKAVSLLEKALETDSLHSGMLSHLGLAHLESGRPDKAREVLERAARVAPNDKNSLYLLGKVCDSLGDSRAAFEANLQAAKADPACSALFGLNDSGSTPAPGSTKRPEELLFRESPDPGEIPIDFFWPNQ